MATIYSPPEAIKRPEFDFQNFDSYLKKCDDYRKNLKSFLQRRKNGKNVGEIIRFPVADGNAEYMVASMRPLELVHIPLGDAWQFQYANRLTAQDVQDKIDQQKAMKELFNKHKKGQ